MSTLLRFVAGDTKPQVEITLTRDDGSAQDLTGASVTVRLRKRGRSEPVEVTRTAYLGAEASQGKAYLLWETGDLDLSAGAYEAEVEVIYSTGGRETVYDVFRLQVREPFE